MIKIIVFADTSLLGNQLNIEIEYWFQDTINSCLSAVNGI